jgi:hypothetical protein
MITDEDLRESRRDCLVACAKLEHIQASDYDALKAYLVIRQEHYSEMLVGPSGHSDSEIREIRGACQILTQLLADFSNPARLLQELKAPNPEGGPSDY